MLNSVSILIQVCERASRVSQLPIIVANTILPTFFNQPDLWLFTIQPTIFPLILEGIVICVVAIIVPHVSFRYFRKTSIVARLRVVE